MWHTGETKAERIDDALRRDRLDALVALTPENAAYLSGRTSGIGAMWRQPGIVVVAVGRDGARAVSAGDSEIDGYPAEQFARFSHPFWIERLDLRNVAGRSLPERIDLARPGGPLARPAQFDAAAMFAAASSAIRTVAPAGGRAGADLSLVSADFLRQLSDALPGVELIDATDVFADLRAIKDPDELASLRLSAALTVAGIAAARDGLRVGQSATAVTAAYQVAIWRKAAADDRFVELRDVEGIASVGDGSQPDVRVGPGQTVKLDMQVDVGGQHSDIGRTFAIAPTADQSAVYAALREALAAAEAVVRPGATFQQVHQAGTEAMRAAGFANYSRGHLGHSIGLAHNYEEPPFVAPDETRPIVPGMAISIELPYYLLGIGAFQLERMLLITDDGHEALDDLPFALAVDANA
ncbi:MAG TPA: Xaa-Pro peptidase family protein [Thermomicrobiales bacterium]|nr:Xaa-Pro peptidase family protein [Thermomicrobiales bacterium]